MAMNKQGVVPWKILIADDDADVHEATRLALRGTRYRDRPLEFVDAYSAVETIERLNENPDTAIVFLDVVMESDDAGLSAAKRIRESGFNLVRIIVRTGFPGYAPERQVIVNYDIHDYKEKSELTVQKLFTSTVSALRAYDDLRSLENHRRSLMSVLESVSWFDFNATKRYIAGMLATFSNLAGLDAEQVVMVADSGGAQGPQLVASMGDWEEAEMAEFGDLSLPVTDLVLKTLQSGMAQNAAAGETLFSYSHEVGLVIYAAGNDAFANADRVLLDVFMQTVCQALNNQSTFANMLDERNALFYSLAMQGECWDENATVNLQRLRSLVTATAQRLQITLVFAAEINDRFVRDIGVAATLHDLGNQALPQDLLTKANALSKEERSVVQTHVEKGLERLTECVGNAKVLASAALAQQVIAAHHEHFDGSGYPAGLSGDSIPLAARIVAVVDSFTALTSARSYRGAMSDAVACELIAAAAGSQFDPRVVQAFLTVIAESQV